MRPGRAVSLLRGAWGLLLLSRPEPVLAVMGPHTPSPELDRAVLRVLGSRQLAQAGVTLVLPGRPVLALGALVDALHAASMVAVAALDRDHRREGLLDASVAGAFAAASLTSARR